MWDRVAGCYWTKDKQGRHRSRSSDNTTLLSKEGKDNLYKNVEVLNEYSHKSRL